MKTDNAQIPTPSDSQTLRNTLFKLCATATIVCAVIIVAVVIIWWDLLNRLISFGRGLDYSGLQALSIQNLALIKQYNPFFWWTVVGIISLIIAYLLHGFVQAVMRRNRQRIVDESTIAHLARILSRPARDVILWAWPDQRNPLTVGDLQRAHGEMRSGRYSKMQLAQQQNLLLQTDYERTEPQA